MIELPGWFEFAEPEARALELIENHGGLLKAPTLYVATTSDWTREYLRQEGLVEYVGPDVWIQITPAGSQALKEWREKHGRNNVPQVSA